MEVTPPQIDFEIPCNSEGILNKFKFFNVWVYKEPSKFPVTIEGEFKNFLITPHQISIENFSTIEKI